LRITSDLIALFDRLASLTWTPTPRSLSWSSYARKIAGWTTTPAAR
jgi:hypothetical protein